MHVHCLIRALVGIHAATESSPVSVCAFCSENHAGVRWMVHRSHDDLDFWDSTRIDTIDIDSQCQDSQGNIIVSFQLHLYSGDSVTEQSQLH